MKSREYEPFRKKMVLAVCLAGADRSRFIAEELNKRGYVASYGGVNRNHNYVTEDDLIGVDSIIFTTRAVRNQFKQDKRLNKALKANRVNLYIIDVTEGEKEKAIQSGNLNPLRETISDKLERLGFRRII